MATGIDQDLYRVAAIEDVVMLPPGERESAEKAARQAWEGFARAQAAWADDVARQEARKLMRDARYRAIRSTLALVGALALTFGTMVAAWVRASR